MTFSTRTRASLAVALACLPWLACADHVADDDEIGWRKAVRIALTETPAKGVDVSEARTRRPPSRGRQTGLPLFAPEGPVD